MKSGFEEVLPKDGPPMPMRTLAVFISLLFLLSSSAGCLDVELFRDVVTEIKGEDELNSRWVIQLMEDGKFDMQMENPPTTIDDWVDKGERLYEKLSENISDPGQDTPQKVRQVLNEEGISMKKKIEFFELPPNTELASLYYNVNFNSILTEDGEITPGYFEMTVKKPDGSTFDFIEKPVYDTDGASDTRPLATDPGLWTIEISGTGFSQAGVSQVYSGEYLLQVRARVIEED